jgi:hypothetical protein
MSTDTTNASLNLELEPETSARLSRPMCFAMFALAAGTLAIGSAQAQHRDGSEPMPPARWSGSGTLHRSGAHASPDRRFALEAKLQMPPSPNQSDPTQRFALSAQLAAPKSRLGNCAEAGDDIFSSSFE